MTAHAAALAERNALPSPAPRAGLCDAVADAAIDVPSLEAREAFDPREATRSA